jgi:phosphatidylethanolamine/phosphatidyl-N-methylethanolamine N-methyltransferase
MLYEYLTFMRELPKSFAEIGAMLPSSPFLARLMVKPIARADRPLRILEVGPGTGPFTREILKQMGPDDVFVICEINQRFISRLRKSLEKNEDYSRNRERIYFFEGPVQALPSSGLPKEYEVIVCGLPFYNFGADLVEEIFHLFRTMVTPGGSLTFFHYKGLRKLLALCSTSETRTRLKSVEQVIKCWCNQISTYGQVFRRNSLLNFPPATSIEFAY